MSNFPNELDTNLEIPRADAGVTEIDGAVVNAIRDAIFNIQKSLGLLPQGNTASLSDRVGISIDSNGNIRPTALEAVGLVTLPIVNSQVSDTAGIEEGKLSLDHSTQDLKNTSSSIQTDLTATTITVDTVGTMFNAHILGLGSYHDGYDIKINRNTFIGVAGLSATTIGDAINEIAGILFNGGHIDTTLPTGIRHVASSISVDASNFTIIDSTVSDAQETFESIDLEISTQQAIHIDAFHNNGILKEINSGDLFNINQPRIESGSGAFSSGTSIIAINGVTSFANLGVKPGDILQISTGSDTGTYRIDTVGPKTAAATLGGLPALAADELSIFYTFVSTSGATNVNIYQPASISSENAPLACAVRHSQSLVDTISVLNPDAARVVSIGLNGNIIASDGYEINIELGLGNGHVRGLTIPDLHLDRLGLSAADTIAANSISERINAYVSDPTLGNHFPVTAFRVGNEIAIAHNLVGSDYTLEVLDGYSGNFALGLDGYGADILDKVVVGNSNNNFNVNGITRSSLSTLVDGTATITSSTNTFALVQNDATSVNPISLGIRSGAVIHITGHPTLDVNGSYTINSVSSTDISLFGAEPIPLVGGSTTFNVKITDSNISLNLLLDAGASDYGLVELYIDETGSVLSYERMTYNDSLGDVDIINITNGFPVGNITINQTERADAVAFAIIENGVVGSYIAVKPTFLGTFKLYHPNNIDYMVLRINSTLSGDLSTSVTTNDPLNEDEAMKICTVHFNGADTITNLVDNRPFGNIDISQVSNSFVEVFIQKPTSELRTDGVARGFDLLDMSLVDLLTNMQALPLNGGTAYINGTRVVVETQKVIIPSFDFNGDIVGNIRKIVGINEHGSIRAFNDSLEEILEDAYVSSDTFGKILPLYAVDLDSDGLISVVTDLRLFINNIDNKIDIIIDESNNVVGNFRTLEGALMYAGSYPGIERPTVKIINEVRPEAAIVIPDGVSIVGTSLYGGRQSRIVNSSDLNSAFITMSGNSHIKNIEIESELAGMDGYLVSVNGPNSSVENCSLLFSSVAPSSNSNDFAINLSAAATSDVKIIGNKIDNVFGGIIAIAGCDRLVIEGNTISNVLGEAAETYGIFVGNAANSISSVTIKNNLINIPTPSGGSEIIGVMFGVSQSIDIVRINGNSIIHANQDTMTNGIRVVSLGGSGSTIKNLIVDDNYIDGVALNSNNVFGIYVDNCDSVSVSSNVLRNIGFGENNNPTDAFIKIGGNTKQVKILNNTLEDGYVVTGIDVTTGNAQILVDGNVIKNVGVKDINSNGTASTSTVFVRCNIPNSVISNNKLVGLGQYGIFLSNAATNCKIDGNMLSGDSLNTVLADTAFLNYGIRILSSETSISNNNIVNMITGSTGISVGSTVVGSKVSENTVNGTLMSALIELDGGSLHTVSGNYLKNDADNSTSMLSLGSSGTAISESLITNNALDGAANIGIVDNSTAGISDTAITGNKMSNVSFTTRAMNLPVAATSGCMITNNDFPSADASVITSTGSNVIGINKNLLDSFAISGIAAQISTFDFAIDSTGLFLEVPSGTSAGTYIASLPITGMPNGSTITSIDLEGGKTNFNHSYSIYRIDHATNSASLLVSTSYSGGAGDFSLPLSSINTVVSHSLYRYVLVISLTSVSAAGINDRFYSAKINIRY